MSENSIIDRIMAVQANLTKGQRRVAEYLLQSVSEAAMLPAAEIGHRAQVSESTVIRLAQALGYPGFPQLQQDLQRRVHERFETVSWFDQSSDRLQHDTGDLFHTVMRDDLLAIQSTMAGLDLVQVETILNAILDARRIYVVGFRSAASVALRLYDGLVQMLPETTLLDMGFDHIPDQLLAAGPDDLLIAVGYARYAQRTLATMKVARAQGLRIVLITDSLLSELAHIADVVLLTSQPAPRYFVSLTSAMSLVNVLLVAIAARLGPDMRLQLERLDHSHAAFGVIYTHAERPQ